LDPLNEALYRFRLAKGHLARAERLLALGDRAGAVHFAQLAVENFAKAIVALYEVPTWSHDPSTDLLPALKGEGSLRADHGFVVNRLHFHHFIAGGCDLHPSRSIRPAVDHGLGLQPVTPIPP